MTITVNPASYLIESTASVNDLPSLHAVLRDWEDSEIGAIHPVTHVWKAMDQGGGAFLYQMDVIAPWQFKFPNAGNYTIKGNLNGTIVPVAGVYVERERATAYTTTAIGGSGPSAESIAAAVLAALNATTGQRTLGQHLQIQTAVLAGNESGAGTTHVTFTDGVAIVEADVPLPGQTGNRSNVTISGV